MRLRLVLAASLAVASFPVAARAQTWLSDRRFAEGIGIRVGNLELHPGVGAEFGYDSNYFQRDDSEDVIDVFRIRVTPHLSLSTLGPQRRGENPGSPPMLKFNASAYASYNEIIAADSQYSDEASDQRNVTLGLTANADIAPHRPLGMDFRGDVQRIAEPSNSPEDEFSWDRWAFRVGTGVAYRPGGGLLEMRLGYDLTYNYFTASTFEDYNNLHHRFGLRGRWRFLPRTALLYDGSYTLIRYTSEAPGVRPDGETVRSRIGMQGLVTYRLALTGMIGWMSSFYDNVPQNQDTITASAEIKYFIQPPPTPGSDSASTGLSTIALGYTREMTNSYVNTFYTRDRGYLGLTYLLGGIFVTSLEGGFSHYTFPDGAVFDSFTQNRIDARLFAEYRFSDTVGLNGTVRYDTNMSGELVSRETGAVADDDLDFARWQAYIGLRWFM
jgi:hypothetical protein